MRKILMSALAVALMLTGANRLSAQNKPVAVISIASYNTVKADLKFVGELAGTPDLDKSLDGIIALATHAQGLKGLDMTKPWGMAVYMEGEKPNGLAFLPINDLKGFLAPFNGQINVQQNGGLLEIQGPSGPPMFGAPTGRLGLPQQR